MDDNFSPKRNRFEGSCRDPLFEDLSLLANVASDVLDQEKEESSKKESKNKPVAITKKNGFRGDELTPLATTTHRSTKKRARLTMKNRPGPKTDLPEEFKHRIKEMGGTRVVMIIEKVLYDSDLNKGSNRLSMPLKQINGSFLSEVERIRLAQQYPMDVLFIEPLHNSHTMVLRQWDMPKPSGKISSSYVLKTHWNKVSKDNNLKKNDLVQVWSFRVGLDQKLGMALVVVKRNGGDRSDDNDK